VALGGGEGGIVGSVSSSSSSPASAFSSSCNENTENPFSDGSEYAGEQNMVVIDRWRDAVVLMLGSVNVVEGV
jgi:hypothetical protein